LRVLQERELERVGGNRTIKVDVRVIATTNRNLEQSVEKKEFRQDLFFRLNVVPIHAPALRERLEDVPSLAEEFMRRFARKHGVQVNGFSEEAINALANHNWPGNVRELQNVVERAVILSGENGMIQPSHLGISKLSVSSPATPSLAAVTAAAVPDSAALTLAEIEKRHILATLDRCKGNRTHAAKLLGVSIRTLRNKLHEYNGSAPNADSEAGEVVEA
jgi:transcriptional regulator with PAS, ATPase and Fis domain